MVLEHRATILLLLPPVGKGPFWFLVHPLTPDTRKKVAGRLVVKLNSGTIAVTASAD
jgi:hypothetical protein